MRGGPGPGPLAAAGGVENRQHSDPRGRGLLSPSPFCTPLQTLPSPWPAVLKTRVNFKGVNLKDFRLGAEKIESK